ncbi:glycosyltransferase [Halostagnicola sp. A-GB9-2]|uniref:glycosyltransferase n=1 Tax=Halostagnicola sp. A-GB9-2 TaxID=3048066 RepID=UPI0024BF2615|nr:glycosyltransferase [Halostagnicola sp. A-GB9-2]MDJ1431956.1 glycosyltransferase [Halostagnicola sp. A-GB9-2]
MSRTVGHFVGSYLPLTETFIYQYLSNYERYEPFVCGKDARNLDLFPFEPRYLFFELPQWSPRFWLYGGLAKLNLRGLTQTYYRHVAKKTDPDIIHANFGPNAVGLLQHRSPERPLVTTFHGYDISELVHRNDSMRRQYERLFETGDLFLVEGPSMREKLLSLGCPKEKIGLQRIAIDTDRITPDYPEPNGEWRILTAGRFTEKKGIPDGIEAFADAFARESGAELRIVGGESDDAETNSGECTQAELEEIASRRGVRDQVTFTGFLEYEEYLAEIQHCDLVLAPSKRAESGDSEGGAPTVLLEAQASGKPVVSTTHADIPYIVEDGAAGRLVTPGAVDELADALQWCRANEDELEEMGRVGRDNVARDHDIQKLIDQLERRYDELLA